MMSAIRYISKICIDYVSRLTYDSLCLAHRGAFSRDDPEGGARCGVLRRRLVTAPREVRDTARQALYDLAARSSLHGLRRKCRRRKRGPRPKIATVERREASVLRHKRVHARLTTHYGTQGASHAPGMSRHDMPNGCRCIRAPVGAPPTPRRWVQISKLGRKRAAGTNWAV